MRVVWFGYSICLLTLTHVPKETMDRMPVNVWDKASHFIAYAILGGLGRAALGRDSRRGRVGLFAMCVAGVLAFGAADELTQPWFGRGTELLDWFADGLGGVFGLMVVEVAGVIGRRGDRAGEPRAVNGVENRGA
jgi:VanZ family protein